WEMSHFSATSGIALPSRSNVRSPSNIAITTRTSLPDAAVLGSACCGSMFHSRSTWLLASFAPVCVGLAPAAALPPARALGDAARGGALPDAAGGEVVAGLVPPPPQELRNAVTAVAPPVSASILRKSRRLASICSRAPSREDRIRAMVSLLRTTAHGYR